MLHLAGGVAFGVDVGDLLELERAFEGDGIVDAAAEEEEVVGGGEGAGEFLALVGDVSERMASSLAGMLESSLTRGRDSASVTVPRPGRV